MRHTNGPSPDVTKVKSPGTFTANDGNEIHCKAGEPNRAIILLMMKEVDGLLDEDGNVDRTIALADFGRGLAR